MSTQKIRKIKPLKFAVGDQVEFFKNGRVYYQGVVIIASPSEGSHHPYHVKGADGSIYLAHQCNLRVIQA